jgi:predicted nucleic acid-binding protein
MSYLLDTCILSKLRRIAKFPNPILQSWIEGNPSHLYFISAFSVAEIQSGIAKLDETNYERKKQKIELEDWLVNKLIPGFERRILDFDLPLALRWGTLIGSCKQKGINLPLIDSLIAATAVHHDLILVTENVNVFIHTNARIINPLQQ